MRHPRAHAATLSTAELQLGKFFIPGETMGRDEAVVYQVNSLGA